MGRTIRVAGAALFLLMLPTTALAGESQASGTVALSVASALISLVFAAVLLVTVVQLERLSRGSAIAESVGYVAAAVLCLATSSLLRWLWLLAPVEYDANQIRAWSDLLVVACMGCLAVYFVRVRRSLTRFLRGSEELLAKLQAADDDWDRQPEEKA